MIPILSGSTSSRTERKSTAAMKSSVFNIFIILPYTKFFVWVSEGSSSYEKRKELFETRKSAVETEIQELQKTLSLLKFKCCQLFDIILFLLFFLLPLCTSSCKKQCHMLKYRTCPHRAEPHHTSSP